MTATATDITVDTTHQWCCDPQHGSPCHCSNLKPCQGCEQDCSPSFRCGGSREVAEEFLATNKLVANYIDDIPRDLAQRAHAGTSFTPDRRAEQERQGYARTLAGDLARLQPLAKTPELAATLTEAFQRYRAGYRAKHIAYLAARSRCMSTMITGPSNFPSAQQRKRGDSADRRCEEMLEYRTMALDRIRTAMRPELRPVMAGDSDAVVRLREKIATAEQLQGRRKEANAAIRKHAKQGAEAQVAALVALGFTEGSAKKLLEPDFAGRIGFPDYEITNNGANIRRMKQRLASIETAKATPDVVLESPAGAEMSGTGIRMEDCPSDNRVRLFFPGKPPAEVRGSLKASGFRWAPSLGCWQAYRNTRSLEVARGMVGVGPGAGTESEG